MPADASLRLFAHLAARPESELDLPRAVLLLAEPEYEGLDVGASLDALDALGATAHARLFGAGRTHGSDRLDSPTPVVQLLQFLYDELGFRGNTEDYYDPRNSFLNEVLTRRVGIPITLGLVLVEVATRAGLRAQGVGFPGHFLVRFDTDEGEPVLVDPFEGRVLDAAALRTLAERAGSPAAASDPRMLEPASKANILIRMLNNLRGIYTAKEEHARLRRTLERLQILAPSTELRQQIEALGGGGTPPPRSRSTSLH